MHKIRLTLYSVYDVNHDNITSVADATKVVCRAIEEIKVDPQVVDATALNALLQSIDRRLSAIENKLGIENREEDGQNTINGYEYVDLGLPSGLKWASCNVGADKPEDYGLFFAWGEVVGHNPDGSDGHRFSWEEYKWFDGKIDFYTMVSKYNDIPGHGSLVDNLTTLELADDAASTNWGGSWRIPTEKEFRELINNCTWSLISKNGITGYEVSNNGNSIFLPAASFRTTIGHPEKGVAYYWSSTHHFFGPEYAWHLIVYPYEIVSPRTEGSGRQNGMSVRPVSE